MGTSYSPKKVYETGLKQALAALKANGAEFDGDRILVPLSPIRELPLEEDAPSDAEVSRKNMPVKFSASAALEFDGRGAVLFPGDEFCKAFRAFAAAQKDKGFAGEIEVVLDGKKSALPNSLPKNTATTGRSYSPNATFPTAGTNSNSGSRTPKRAFRNSRAICRFFEQKIEGRTKL